MDIEKLISIINSKRAMLFCGAGFSFGSTNLNGRSPLNSKGLSKAFSTASGIPENDNLYFTSEYLLDKMGSRYIIDFLKKEYTTPKIADHHKIICSLPWRRIYTTNYDNIIEQSYLDGAFQLNSVDIDDNPSDFFQSGNMCLHINGSISNLSDSTLNSSFRLTDSSYISAEPFHNSPWFSIFKRDLDKSEAIVFIGYSLYDFEIKKLLKENEFYKAKTFFICAPEPNFEETFILGKYGTTFPIGVSGFSDEITKCKNEENVTHAIDYHLVSLSKYEITDRHEIEIKDNDIENMLSYGVIDDESIDEFVLGNIKTPFLIKRNTTNLIADTLLRAGGHVVVYGALGNGKSFLLRQLKTLLCSNGLSVYVLDDIDADYVSDIDYLSSLNSKNIIFIDGYDKYLPVIEYISRTNQKNIRLVISARVAEHEYGRKKLSLYNLKYKEFNIDILDESEIEQFIDIVNNLGVWGENAGLSFQDKKSKLKTEHDAQISIILLLLLESPQIKQRLNDLMKDIISPQRASTIFSICLCNILGIPIERSVISELACSDDIYSPYYTTDDKFRQVIKATSEGGFAPGSSLFSVFIVKHYFSATAVTKYLLQIADKYERLRFNGEIDKHIFKSMLKFSFIERVMPSNTKLGNMQSYYESLKTHIKWLTNDSHFWLQYAMCYIAFDDFNKAQQKLDEAYGIASRKTDYHTFNIDTQQAKVYLLSSKKISDSHIAFSNFEKAHSLLNGVPNDIYKIRQLLNYEAFYRDNYSKLSKQNKIQFHRYCKKTLDDLNKILSGHGDGISFTLLHKTIRLFEHLSNTTDAPVAALSDDEIDR